MGELQDARLAAADERRDTVVMMREWEGATFAEIGAEIGVSGARASEMYRRALEIRKEREFGMTARSRRIMEECGHSIEELRSKLERGEKQVEAVLLRRAGCQMPQVREIIDWLRSRPEVGANDDAAIV